MNGAVLLLIVGRVFGPGMPEIGQHVVTAQLVTAQQCAMMAYLTPAGVKAGDYTLLPIERPLCGHAKDWARLVLANRCTETLVNNGKVKITRCAQ